jgi:hypothetical protein
MRTHTVAVCLAAVTVAALTARQDKPQSRTPQKGDAVIVEGCLRGGTLESTRTTAKDASGTLDTALIYRLTGDKKALKAMREEHDGEVVEVTGELKSKLPAGDGRGTQIGKTRIFVGVADPRRGSPLPSQNTQSIPVLEMKSFEPRSVKCG